MKQAQDQADLLALCAVLLVGLFALVQAFSVITDRHEEQRKRIKRLEYSQVVRT